mgnify:CR=1 FL=1
MSGNISLTASMRSNLLSLQNISRTVGSTQNKLATGNKVNSAIDNPSSYYTARSLNNRANDLDALLDSMGQAVSTIKTATTALETGATFLEQAAAVATSALETNTIPPKAFFEEKVGENGAVVTTAQELKDAIDAGKETICVYGQIDYFTDKGINLQNGQKLVGTEYFTGYTGKERYSKLNFYSQKPVEAYVGMSGQSSVSDLDINAFGAEVGRVIYSGHDSSVSIYNIAFNSSSQLNYFIQLRSSADISGHIKMSGDNVAHGIWTYNMSNDPKNITISGVLEENIKKDLFTIRGADGLFNGNMHITIKEGTILKNDNSYIFGVQSDAGKESNDVVIEPNVTIVSPSGAIKSTQSVKYTSNSQTDKTFSMNMLKADPSFTVGDYVEIKQRQTDDNYGKRYSEILNQYDTLVKDSSYKGVNLLKNEKLNVRFNEKGDADLNVNGKDMSSNALGLNTVDWQNQGDIAQSLKEIAGALKSIRAFTAELGNNYSIITNRQEFTENLINILTEGADKLTLADMNEESANMLSLQTRQQLAINSLSLASQAAQAVLKLF